MESVEPIETIQKGLNLLFLNRLVSKHKMVNNEIHEYLYNDKLTCEPFDALDLNRISA